MYVANSEPARWQRVGGRAGLTRQVLISGEPNRSGAGRDMGRQCVLPGEGLLERVYDSRRLRQAWEQIRKNAGAAGIDGMTIQQFKSRQQELLSMAREKLDRYIRNRLRAMQLKKWKKPKKFQRMLRRAGFAPSIAGKTWMKMNCWRSVFRREVLILCDLAWFRRQGLIFLDDYTNRNLELQFSC